MTKTEKPKKYANLSNEISAIAEKTKANNPFRSEEEFEGWLESQLDDLEKRYAAFATNESLRGFFGR